jgi:hypothetical protein
MVFKAVMQSCRWLPTFWRNVLPPSPTLISVINRNDIFLILKSHKRDFLLICKIPTVAVGVLATQATVKRLILHVPNEN